MKNDKKTMTPWDELETTREKKRREKRRTIRVITGVAVLLLTGITAAVLIWPGAFNFSLASLIAAEPPRPPRGDKAFPAVSEQPQRQSGAPDQLSGGLPFFNKSFGSDHLARLETNLGDSTTPSLQYTPPVQNKGPRRLEYVVSGSGQEHKYVVGKATYGRTEIVGAAGEWQVRPWWKPGWLTASVDCGQIGTAAIAGHVSWADRPGPFNDLGAMQAGDQIRCQATNGTWYTYEVTEVVRIDYTETDYYWRPLESNTAELSLFTCTPEISGIIVVRARLSENIGVN